MDNWIGVVGYAGVCWGMFSICKELIVTWLMYRSCVLHTTVDPESTTGKMISIHVPNMKKQVKSAGGDIQYLEQILIPISIVSLLGAGYYVIDSAMGWKTFHQGLEIALNLFVVASWGLWYAFKRSPNIFHNTVWGLEILKALRYADNVDLTLAIQELERDATFENIPDMKELILLDLNSKIELNHQMLETLTQNIATLKSKKQ